MRAARILSISNHPNLAHARQLVLESRHFEVETFRSSGALAGCQGKSFDVVLLGHTVPRKEKQALVTELRHRFPGIKVIDLLSSAEGAELRADATCQVHDGPYALLEVISSVLPRDADTAPTP